MSVDGPKQNAEWIPPTEPRFSFPSLINAHIHPATARPDRTPYPISPKATYRPCIATVQDIEEVMSFIGCTEGYVLKGQTCFDTDNSSLIDTLRHVNRVRRVAIGIATIDETVPEEEVIRLKQEGVVGARFAFPSHLVKSEEDAQAKKASLLKMGGVLAKHGMSADIYFPLEELDGGKLKLRDTIRALSEKGVPIVLDHMCLPKPELGVNQPAFQSLIRLGEECTNIHFLISGPDRILKNADPRSWNVVQPFKAALVAKFPDRVQFGTDFNHPNSEWGVPDDGKLLDWALSGLSDEQVHKIGYANPKQFFYGEAVPAFDPTLHRKIGRISHRAFPPQAG